MIGIVRSSNMCENSTRDALGWEFSWWERFLGAKSMLLDNVSLCFSLFFLYYQVLSSVLVTSGRIHLVAFLF